jgi:hypothetical protein
MQNMHLKCSWTLKLFNILCKQDNVWSFEQWNHLLLCYMQSQQDTTMLSGFGINVLLRWHIDKDFTKTIVQVHLDEIMYQNDDRIVCYFAFPQIGIAAVALQPGDILMFNPQEPHSISLYYNKNVNIYCISSYLKTQVMRLNDNSNMVV